jgi:opacity protein-like surface antigen
MKYKIAAIFALLLCCLSVTSQENKFSLGVNAGVGTELDGSPIYGVVFQYKIGNHFRLVPEVGVSFQNNPDDYMEDWVHYQFNLNVHYLFHLNKLNIYPLAGFVIGNWHDRITSLSWMNLGSVYPDKIVRSGANFGVGIQYHFFNKIYIDAESKYSFLWRMSDNNGTGINSSANRLNNFVLTLGVGYLF